MFEWSYCFSSSVNLSCNTCSNVVVPACCLVYPKILPFVLSASVSYTGPSVLKEKWGPEEG